MAEAIVSIVVGRLTDLLIEEAQLLREVREEIEQVVTELRRMKTFLPDADLRLSDYTIRDLDTAELRILLANVRELAYDAEHVVETFLVKAFSSTGKTIQWFNKIKFSRKIKDIQRRMSLLFNRFHDCNIKSTLESPESSSISFGTQGKLERFYSYATVEPEIFVGFQEDVDRLVGHLVDESDDSYSFISICGMGGLGKTTLAKKIYNHSSVKTCFAGLAWVSISQKWQRKQVLQRILICLVHEKKDEILSWDDDKLVENLLQIQERKKCLIVLDDIWSTDAWDSIKAAFPAEKSVSKLMLTSRNVEVAEHVNPKGLVHQPESLSADQSWELLKLKALPKGGDCLDITRDVNKMEELGREMVGRCGGLPLAIVILGGILVTKPSLIEWEKVYYDSLSSLKKGKGLGEDPQKELFDILITSYNDLPLQLKPCFLYLGKFSEDEWIETDTIYQLWIAEGMVLSSDKRDGETMMQVAESYMGELVHKSLVQVRVNEVESSLTKFKSCSLHDIMRELSLSQAKEIDFFEVVDLQEGNDFDLNPSVDLAGYGRQLVVHLNEGSTSEQANSYFVKKSNRQRYRSMILLNKSKKGSLPPVLLSHVSIFRLLRVFSLEEVEFDHDSSIKLGRVLESLVYLRYLSLRKTSLLIFPSIQKLVLLQTLKLDKLGMYDDLIVFPSLSGNVLVKLLKLGHLRHLYLPNFNAHTIKKIFKFRFDGLSKLETLENFNTDWCEVKDLPKLISLQKLTITVLYNDVEEMMKYLEAIVLSPISCLRYLAISIIGYKDIYEIPLYHHGSDVLRQLMLWDQNFNLQLLRIFGQLPGRLWDLSLICITRLELFSSLLEEDPMPVLGKILTLRELHLDEAYVGTRMVCLAMSFPKLIKLYIYNLPCILEWRVEKGSMPCLSRLLIGICPRLSGLPDGLRFLDSLKKLRLYSMPKKFCDRVGVVNGEPGPDLYIVAHIPVLSIETD